MAAVVFTTLTAFNRLNQQIKMESRFTTLTLGVDNVEKSFKFYHEGLGLSSKGIIGKEFEHVNRELTAMMYPVIQRDCDICSFGRRIQHLPVSL